MIEAWLLHSPPVHFWGLMVILAGVAIGSFYTAFRRLRRVRIIEDTPTAKIRSAHQGYVELEGWARMLPGEPIYAPLSNRPCVWYEYTIEHRESTGFGSRRHSRWSKIAHQRSDAIFALEDATGQCVIDPDGAEVIPERVLTWYGHDRTPGASPPGQGALIGPYRFSEKILEPGKPLYAIGLFTTMGEGGGSDSLETETRELILQWKHDQNYLLKRFDLNQDGKIDEKEWRIVRKQAAKEAVKQRLEKPPEPVVNLLKKPLAKDQPFILSAIPQDKLISHFRISSGWIVGVFVLCCGLLAWALKVRLHLALG